MRGSTGDSDSLHAQWIHQIKEEEKVRNIRVMERPMITLEKVQRKIMKSNNWKAPGPDTVPNFWIKKITALHVPLTNCLNNIIDTAAIPDWLVSNKTLLLPESN